AESAIDFLTGAEAGVRGLPDSEVLELASRQGRILVSHDTSTMPVHFAARLQKGLQSPGVLLVRQRVTLNDVIVSLVMIWSASSAAEWMDHIHYLPSLSRHVFRS